jgi:hypothetical protein
MISKNDWQHKLLLSDLPLHLRGMGCIMAEYADGTTGEHIHPGLARLERECHVNPKTAIRNIAQLVKSGWLVKTYDARTGPEREYTNEYRLTIPSDHVTWLDEIEIEERGL